jgi:hypothetical protein
MSGMTGSMDSLLSLLDVIKDPDTHKKRVLEFQAREKAALDAEAKLAASKSNIATDRAQLKEDQAAHDGVVAAFLPEKKRILDKATAFDEMQRKLDAREAVVAEREAVLKTESAGRASEWASGTALASKRQAELDAREARCLSRETDLAAKEKLVADKLSKLRQAVSDV